MFNPLKRPFKISFCFNVLKEKQKHQYYIYKLYHNLTFRTFGYEERSILGTIVPIIENYRKVPKFSDTRKLCCNHHKTGKKRFYHQIMHPKGADSIANSEDPD